MFSLKRLVCLLVSFGMFLDIFAFVFPKEVGLFVGGTFCDCYFMVIIVTNKKNMNYYYGCVNLSGRSRFRLR